MNPLARRVQRLEAEGGSLSFGLEILVLASYGLAEALTAMERIDNDYRAGRLTGRSKRFYELLSHCGPVAIH